MIKSLIVACDENYLIGNENKMIWYLPADLKHFKLTTSGHHIIMGRKTFESIGRPLPNRTSIIVTRQKDYTQEGCLIAHSLEEAFEMAKSDSEAFVIGGGEIYKQALELVDKLHITRVHHQFEGDCYFTKPDFENWKLTESEIHKANEKNAYDYTFEVWEKI